MLSIPESGEAYAWMHGESARRSGCTPPLTDHLMLRDEDQQPIPTRHQRLANNRAGGSVQLGLEEERKQHTDECDQYCLTEFASHIPERIDIYIYIRGFRNTGYIRLIGDIRYLRGIEIRRCIVGDLTGDCCTLLLGDLSAKGRDIPDL